MALQLDLNKRYTYADYLTWMDEARRELIDGFIKLMTPAPTRKHQNISGNLFYFLKDYLRKGHCHVFHAPFDVRLSKNGEKEGNKIYTVVQPDISIICDPAKLDERGCIGPPDMIVEIVSRHNPERDIKEKFRVYQEHGVAEYWIVFPNDKAVSVFLLGADSKYQLVGMYAGDDLIPVNSFNGDLQVHVEDIFEES